MLLQPHVSLAWVLKVQRINYSVLNYINFGGERLLSLENLTLKLDLNRINTLFNYILTLKLFLMDLFVCYQMQIYHIEGARQKSFPFDRRSFG